MISVAVAMPTVPTISPSRNRSRSQPRPSEPEPAGESEVAAQARAAAGAVATRDDGAGKVLSTADIVAESEPSVALIKGKGSSGTGFLVGPGLVATNAHVIDDELIPDLEVRFVSADDKHKAPLKAELLYEDPQRDLAFLAVKTDLKPLRVAKTYTFRKGEDITVIGNPGLGDGQVLENAISRGVMSTKTQIDGRNFYQLGIAINPGNSGGPVFDSSGRVIGVATLKASKQEATGFSIPIEDFQEALTKLSKQSTADADGYRSRHRINASVKALGGGGALMCLIIDLRRAASTGSAGQERRRSEGSCSANSSPSPPTSTRTCSPRRSCRRRSPLIKNDAQDRRDGQESGRRDDRELRANTRSVLFPQERRRPATALVETDPQAADHRTLRRAQAGGPRRIDDGVRRPRPLAGGDDHDGPSRPGLAQLPPAPALHYGAGESPPAQPPRSDGTKRPLNTILQGRQPTKRSRFWA